MKRLALLFVSIAATWTGCATPLEPSQPSPPAPPAPVDAAPPPELGTLRGLPIEVRADGPWRYRVAATPATPAPSADAAEDLVGGAVEGGLGGVGAGAFDYPAGGGAGYGRVGVGSGGGGSGGVAVRGYGSGAGRGRVVPRIRVGAATVSGRVTRPAMVVVPGAEPSAEKPAEKGGPGAVFPGAVFEEDGGDAEPDGAYGDDDGEGGPVTFARKVEPADTTPLRAGSTDDNADLAGFLAFLEGAQAAGTFGAVVRPIDVRDRRFLRVVDERGRPVPGARVHVTDEAADRVVWDATTYGDGLAPYYPGVAGAAALPSDGWLVEAWGAGSYGRRRWDGVGETVDVTLRDRYDPPAAVPVDVLFLVDTTGSMQDEIDRIKETLLRVTALVRALDRPVDLRYGALLYRDLEDEYLTAVHPFTADVEAFDAALRAVEADGGGDTPEALNQGLHEAVHRMRWRDGAARVAFLIADAPPHMDYEGDTEYPESLRDAVARGIRVHAVAASGLESDGTVVFRQIAQFTRGRFVFIQYGTLAESAAGHGVTGETVGNDLDAILFDRIRAEVVAFGGGDAG